MRIHSIESEYEVYYTNFRFKSKINEKGISIQVLVYSLDQISPLGLAQYIVLVIYSYYLYYTHTSLYKSIYCTLLFTHTIYRLFSLSLSHFILLLWYRSHCSDLVVFSDVLPLPSPSLVATVRSESSPSHPTTTSRIQSIHQLNHRTTVVT